MFYNLSNQDIDDIKNGRCMLIDVRTLDEHAEGHAPHSHHYALDSLSSAALPDPKNSGKLFLYCRSGARAEAAKQHLQSRGYDAHNLGGLDNVVSNFN